MREKKFKKNLNYCLFMRVLHYMENEQLPVHTQMCMQVEFTSLLEDEFGEG